MINWAPLAVRCSPRRIEDTIPGRPISRLVPVCTSQVFGTALAGPLPSTALVQINLATTYRNLLVSLPCVGNRNNWRPLTWRSDHWNEHRVDYHENYPLDITRSAIWGFVTQLFADVTGDCLSCFYHALSRNAGPAGVSRHALSRCTLSGHSDHSLWPVCVLGTSSWGLTIWTVHEIIYYVFMFVKKCKMFGWCF